MLFLVPFSGSMKMDDFSLIKGSFALLTFLMVFMSSLINICENHLPDHMRSAFRYGKFAYNGKKSQVPTIEVPKSWFKHFYVYSSILTVFTLSFMILRLDIPELFHQFMDLVAGTDRQTTVSYTHSLFAMSLLTVQCCRRFYDTHYVSIFGKNCKMNIAHYIIGICHYTGATAAILAEAPLRSISRERVNVNLISTAQWTAAILFLWACYQQHAATVILANLRKNKDGKVVSQEHKIPYGGLFQYLSSPHFTAEILMYFALAIILWGNTTWLYVFMWVFCNQTETSLLSHWWYLEKFPEYPKNRKALIPFIY